MRSVLLPAMLAGLCALSAAASADERPPADALPLSQVLAGLERGGDVAAFDEIEWDDGRWEIEYFAKDGSRREIKVDPRTGAPQRR